MITVTALLKKGTFFAIVLFCLGIAAIASADQPGGTGQHYELNIIGFSKCTMTTSDGTYPDCFKGQAGPSGHVIFIPLKTSQEVDLCQNGTTLPGTITNADLYKGVRILVTDGPQLQVLDKDRSEERRAGTERE